MKTITWQRVWGPEETCECGDVEYEIGSTYQSSDGIVATIVYFVAETRDNTYGVEYKCESWPLGQEDDSTVSYDWASALVYYSLDEAIAQAKAYAAKDESYVFM